MNIKPQVIYQYRLSPEDVEEAVRRYIKTEGGVVGDAKLIITTDGSNGMNVIIMEKK